MLIPIVSLIAIVAAVHFFGLLGVLLSLIAIFPLAWKHRSDPEAGILAWIKRRAHASVHAQWSGRYYTFDERQVRFYLVNDTVWTATADVMQILEPPPGERELRLLGAEYAPIPDTDVMAFSEAGLLRLLNARTDNRRASYHMIRFKNWIENQAFPNVKRLPSSATALIRADETSGP